MPRDETVDLREVGRRRLGSLRRDVGHGEARVELGGGERHLVEVVLGPEEHAHRDHADVQLFEHRGRQIARRIGHDADALRSVPIEAGLVLRPHVLDLRLRDLTETGEGFEELLRLVGVHVHAHPRGPSRDDDRVSRQSRLPPEGVPVDRVPFEKRLRTESEENGLGRPVEHGRADLFRRDRRERAARRVAHVTHDALEQVDETLRPGIDDPRLLERLHLLRRVLERSLRFFQRVGQDFGEVRDVARALRDAARPVADDGQDRSLDRPGDGMVRGLGRREGGGAEVPRRDARAVWQPFAETAEELRQDRTGVAAGAAQGLVGQGLAHPPDVPLAEAGDPGRDLLQGGGEIRTGVAVGHREDVDLVERFCALRDEVRTRDDGPREAAAVQVRDRDHGLSGAGWPSRARSTLRSERNSSATAGSRSR